MTFAFARRRSGTRPSRDGERSRAHVRKRARSDVGAKGRAAREPRPKKEAACFPRSEKRFDFSAARRRFARPGAKIFFAPGREAVARRRAHRASTEGRLPSEERLHSSIDARGRPGSEQPPSPRRARIFFSSPRREAGGREKDAPLGGRGVCLTASRRGEGFLRRNPSPSLESSGFFFGEATRGRGRPLDPHAASPRPRIEGGARAPELSSRAFFFAARDDGGSERRRG